MIFEVFPGQIPIVDFQTYPAANVRPTHTARLFHAAVCEAAALLRADQVVAVPTETVYGLAANALRSEAVSRIFEIKGRPAHNPIIVHVAGIEMAKRCVARWPPLGQKLARAFWPGPLTLVLPRAREIPDIVAAGGPTIGVRWPSHQFIQQLIRKCGFPLAAPSANPSNRLSPTTAGHVRKYFGSRIPLIVDGGQCPIGIESTVLDLTTAPPRLLRPGVIHEQALLSITRQLQLGVDDQGKILKSPGLLPRHYSPKARLVLWSWPDEQRLRNQIMTQGLTLKHCHLIVHTHTPSGQGFGRVSVLPHDAVAFARSIYAELHQSDDAGARLIIVEAVPEFGEWRAISDRLKRAATS